MATISIIINCRNGEKYLENAIKSSLGQSFDSFELILFDNQSTDKTSDIFKSFASRDHRLKYHRASTPLPLGAARNEAVKLATSDWIAFLDCDDYWFPDHIEKLMDAVHQKSSTQIGLCYSRVEVEYQNGRREPFSRKWGRRGYPSGNILGNLLEGENFIALNSAIILRSAYLNTGGIPANFSHAEDYFLLCQISMNYLAQHSDHCGGLYRIHGNNLSFRQRSQGAREVIETIKYFAKTLPENERKRANMAVRDWRIKSLIYEIYENRSLSFDRFRQVLSLGITKFLNILLKMIAAKLRQLPNRYRNG